MGDAAADTREIERARSLAWGEQLAACARKRPNKSVVVMDEQSLTYGELDERATLLGRAMVDGGVSAGDRVILLMTNRLEFVESMFAGWRVGAIVVPVNFRLAAAEIAYILTDTGARMALVDTGLAALFTDAMAIAGTSLEVVVTGPGSHDVAAEHGWTDYAAAMASADGATFDVCVDDRGPAAIVYTSGTTGRPKGAVLTHHNLTMNALSEVIALGVSDDDEVWATGLPLFHIGGFGDLLPYMIAGGTLVILPTGNFDATATVEVLERQRVTGCVFVPTQWQAICALPGLRERRLPLRRAAWGAAPSPMELLELLAATFPDIDQFNAFGQTEMSPTTTLLDGKNAVRKMGSVGRVLMNVEARIVDDEMKDVPVGEVGEIVYRGPCVFTGYWNNPAATAEAFAGGWFHSGDLCRMDDEGFVYAVDRKNDMIVSGGENIYSAEVEEAVRGCPGVLDVAVVGLPHATWGETPCAVVVPCDPTDPPTAQAVIDHCRSAVASYKKPTSVVIRDSLPRNPTGKVLKHILRAELRDIVNMEVTK